MRLKIHIKDIKKHIKKTCFELLNVKRNSVKIQDQNPNLGVNLMKIIILLSTSLLSTKWFFIDKNRINKKETINTAILKIRDTPKIDPFRNFRTPKKPKIFRMQINEKIKINYQSFD